MRRPNWKILLPLLALALLCSCGDDGKTKKEQTSNKKKVEDPVASAVFKNSKNTVKESWYENDFTHIALEHVEDGDYGEEMWMYENRKDSKGSQKDYKGSFDDFIPALDNVMWITNDWLYYSDYEDESVYRVPILYDAGEFQLDVDKKELLFPASAGGNHDQFMVTDSYILAVSTQEGTLEDVWVRYDFETKEAVKVDLPETVNDEPANLEIDDSTGLPIIINNSFFTSFDDGDDYENDILCQVSLDTLKGERICSDFTWGSDNSLLVHESGLYFINSSGIVKYNGEITDVFVCSTMKDKLEEMEIIPDGTSMKSVSVGSIYSRKDRLYAVLTVECRQKEPKRKGYDYKTWDQNVEDIKKATGAEQIDCVYGKGVVISADYSDFTKWEQETKLSEYIQEHGAYEMDWEEQDYESDKLFYFDQPFHVKKITDDELYFEYVDAEKYKHLKEYESVETAAVYRFSDGSIRLDPEKKKESD